MAVQTASMADFRKTPIDTELFVKDRWTGLAASESILQCGDRVDADEGAWQSTEPHRSTPCLELEIERCSR